MCFEMLLSKRLQETPITLSNFRSSSAKLRTKSPPRKSRERKSGGKKERNERKNVNGKRKPEKGMMRNRALDTIRVKVAWDVEGEGKKFHMILSESTKQLS